MRYLLDKNIVRHAISGLYHGQRRLLSPLEASALSFWQKADKIDAQLFISHRSFHVLRQMSHYSEVRLLLNKTEVLYPTRYHARWARRIRETAGLSREDSAIIGLATFSTNQSGSIFGANYLITYDRPMINGYTAFFTKLQQRLHTMRVHLSNPFRAAELPQVQTPEQVFP